MDSSDALGLRCRACWVHSCMALRARRGWGMTVDSLEFMLCRLRVQRRSNERSYLIGLRKGGGGDRGHLYEALVGESSTEI